MNAPSDLTGLKILVVDDEPANVALLRYILTAAGYTRLCCVMDARQAMPAFSEFAPDLILLDLMMPFVSGFEIMEQIRAITPAADALPILVLTADVNTESKHRALLAGASDFLTKPFDQVEALLRIRHLLQLRSQHQQLAQHNDHLEDTVRERTGELRATLGRLEDTLHQLRSTQQQVIQHERLSALGSMAAGLAHDFNNSLSLILGYSELLLSELATTPYREQSDEYLGTVITAAQDAARMFGRLRSIYRQADHDQDWQTVDLNALVEQAATLTRPRWHGQALGQGVTIRLGTDLAPALPALLADAAELREMLTNLIFNAVDALPAGGEITLRTRVGAGEDEVVLEVADTGVGMDEETRRRCLEPFFTTKGQKGTGLGLAMVYGTMQRHGGRIELESQLGRGTMFRFYLPVEAKIPEPVPTPSEDVRHSLRILAVDDQPVLCEILAEHLTEDWHTVESAADGREALEMFRAHAAGLHPYDLVITDKAMPHMNGEQLATAVKAMAPGTRVIMLTGYGAPPEGGLLPANVDMVVDKPVTRQALREAVARVMAEGLTMPAVAMANC